MMNIHSRLTESLWPRTKIDWTTKPTAVITFALADRLREGGGTVSHGHMKRVAKKSTSLSLFDVFTSLPVGDTSESVGATFGQVLMYTEPQKKIQNKNIVFSWRNFTLKILPQKIL